MPRAAGGVQVSSRFEARGATLAAQPSLDPETVAAIEGLELRARHIVQGYVAGHHPAPTRGFSTEFAEHRRYVRGDDPRYLDWKVLGRTGKFYLKRFHDEADFGCFLVVDASESMAFRGRRAVMSKLEYARSVAAALTFLVLQQHDRVGLAVCDHSIRDFLRPASTQVQMAAVLDLLQRAAAKGESDMGAVLLEMAARTRRRALFVVIGDLLDDVASVVDAIGHLRHRRHEVVVMHVLDPDELDLPYDEPVLFRGLERQPDVKADALRIRPAYQREVQRYLDEIRAGCRDHQVDYELLPTNRSFAAALRAYLTRRRRE